MTATERIAFFKQHLFLSSGYTKDRGFNVIVLETNSSEQSFSYRAQINTLAGEHIQGYTWDIGRVKLAELMGEKRDAVAQDI